MRVCKWKLQAEWNFMFQWFFRKGLVCELEFIDALLCSVAAFFAGGAYSFVTYRMSVYKSIPEYGNCIKLSISIGRDLLW
jgi:hypothetical protein